MSIKFLLVGIFLFCAGVQAHEESFIARTLQASFQGRLSAWVTPEHSLLLKYNEEGHGGLRLCNNSNAWGKVSVLFVTGPKDRRIAIERNLDINCTYAYPANPNNATFYVSKADDLELWNLIFPKNEHGDRSYTLEVAFLQKIPNFSDLWDSDFGHNYTLIFE